jgi:hypothetical protein
MHRSAHPREVCENAQWTGFIGLMRRSRRRWRVRQYGTLSSTNSRTLSSSVMKQRSVHENHRVNGEGADKRGQPGNRALHSLVFLSRRMDIANSWRALNFRRDIHRFGHCFALEMAPQVHRTEDFPQRSADRGYPYGEMNHRFSCECSRPFKKSARRRVGQIHRV